MSETSLVPVWRGVLSQMWLIGEIVQLVRPAEKQSFSCVFLTHLIKEYWHNHNTALEEVTELGESTLEFNDGCRRSNINFCTFYVIAVFYLWYFSVLCLAFSTWCVSCLIAVHGHFLWESSLINGVMTGQTYLYNHINYVHLFWRPQGPFVFSVDWSGPNQAGWSCYRNQAVCVWDPDMAWSHGSSPDTTSVRLFSFMDETTEMDRDGKGLYSVLVQYLAFRWNKKKQKDHRGKKTCYNHRQKSKMYFWRR